jgi:hypothetical protein
MSCKPLFVFVCSDFPNSGELHAEDYCYSIGSRMDDAALSAGAFRYACEREISSVLCPPGWAYYKDNGYEGEDSCLRVSATAVSTWTLASTGCWPGSHLLTVASSITSAGLMAFATALHPSQTNFHMGCSQATSSSARAMGWAWIDGTPASNLNCGAGGNGCGIWNTNEPKYVRSRCCVSTGILLLFAAVSVVFAFAKIACAFVPTGKDCVCRAVRLQ